MEKNESINNLIDIYSSEFDYNNSETAIILAAGHGKRIKSQTSKMLHEIWGVPTVERVYSACRRGLNGVNSIVVVGIKAEDVIKVIGNRKNTLFAHQEVQNGTGHAVQVALENIDKNKYNGIVYVLPGDMGLIDEKTVSRFKAKFLESGADMMVLTGIFDGPAKENSYGRIIRVKDKDAAGNDSGNDTGKVIEILEHKDILGLKEKEPYKVKFADREYSYTKKELLENNEFNSGVYAFKFDKLIELITELQSNNVQNEIYITDLIGMFNQKGYTVDAISPTLQHVIMGFNNKSVLRQMDAIARNMMYERVKDIIEIDDPDDFFIEESIIDQIIKHDANGVPLDIRISKGVYIGKGVELNYNLTLGKNVYVNGNVSFGKNVNVEQGVHLSCYPDQKFIIGDDVEILWGNIIKGNIIIGNGSRIESSVNMTGSDEYPLRIGKNVTIKGTSYLFGTIVDDDIFIEHSVLINKRVDKLYKKDGMVQKIKFFLPMPEGIDAIEDLD
jgi:bifunctional UDP-N-acetylglucosamine pyrophosphorylase/glucosamine-1-phosphate N-acetyltransferase